MIAARRRELRPRAFCLAHTAILEDPRAMICVGGLEKGRLRRDVTKERRRRRFLICAAPERSPSTSASGRLLFGWRNWHCGEKNICDDDEVSEKESFHGCPSCVLFPLFLGGGGSGVGGAVNEKTSQAWGGVGGLGHVREPRNPLIVRGGSSFPRG